MDMNTAITQSVESQDRIAQTRTLYDVSSAEVFWKNFLAGFGRAIGGLFIYAIFLAISIYSFMTYAYPKIAPFITEYEQAIQGINQLNKSQTTGGVSPAQAQQYQQLIKDLNNAH